MRLIFLGTPEIAVPSLEAIVRAGHDVCRVLAQPDRPRDRGHRVKSSPVHSAADRLGLNFTAPTQLRSPGLAEELADLKPDYFVVVAYGRLIPDGLLQRWPQRWVNLHPSLLPLYRGPAPIQAPLFNGDQTTGVTTMYITPDLDAGDILLQYETPIDPDETAGELHDRLAVLGAECVVETMMRLDAGILTAQPQDHAKATYTTKLTKADGLLDFRHPAERLRNHIRAVTPWPGATGQLDGMDCKLWRADALKEQHHAAPGTVVRAQDFGIDVATGLGTLRVRELQRSGKRRMSAEQFLRGFHLAPGARFLLPEDQSA